MLQLLIVKNDGYCENDNHSKHKLPGHEGYGTIEIVYDFKPGVQVRYTSSSLFLSPSSFQGSKTKFLALCKCGDWNKITAPPPPNLSIITTYFSLYLSLIRMECITELMVFQEHATYQTHLKEEK